MSVLKKIHRFLQLPPIEKRLFAEAYLTLGIMRLYILTRPFKQIVTPLSQFASVDEIGFESSPELARNAVRIGKTIARAAAHTPWESACLAQSLTAWKMLQKRGIPGYFVLGAKPVKEQGGTMSAHAWSKCGEHFLTGKSGHEAFTVLSVFCWSGK